MTQLFAECERPHCQVLIHMRGLMGELASELPAPPVAAVELIHKLHVVADASGRLSLLDTSGSQARTSLSLKDLRLLFVRLLKCQCCVWLSTSGMICSCVRVWLSTRGMTCSCYGSDAFAALLAVQTHRVRLAAVCGDRAVFCAEQ